MYNHKKKNNKGEVAGAEDKQHELQFSQVSSGQKGAKNEKSHACTFKNGGAIKTRI